MPKYGTFNFLSSFGLEEVLHRSIKVSAWNVEIHHLWWLIFRMQQVIINAAEENTRWSPKIPTSLLTAGTFRCGASRATCGAHLFHFSTLHPMPASPWGEEVLAKLLSLHSSYWQLETQGRISQGCSTGGYLPPVFLSLCSVFNFTLDSVQTTWLSRQNERVFHWGVGGQLRAFECSFCLSVTDYSKLLGRWLKMPSAFCFNQKPIKSKWPRTSGWWRVM